MILIDASQEIIIAKEVRDATTFWQRLLGLLGKKDLSVEQGLIIEPCKIVHTFFMKFALDIIFLNQRDRVVNIIENMPPNRISPFINEAQVVVELKAGVSKNKEIRLGNKIISKKNKE